MRFKLYSTAVAALYCTMAMHAHCEQPCKKTVYREDVIETNENITCGNADNEIDCGNLVHIRLVSLDKINHCDGAESGLSECSVGQMISIPYATDEYSCQWLAAEQICDDAAVTTTNIDNMPVQPQTAVGAECPKTGGGGAGE